MKKIGVIGCGTIGTQICLAIDQGKVTSQLAGVADIDVSKAQELIRQLQKPCPILDWPDLISQADLIVEAAGQRVVPQLIEMVLTQAKEVLVMSVGGLLSLDSLEERFRNSGSRLYVPSGAIAGLDAIKAARLGGLQAVTLTTRKPPRGLKGAPYCEERGIDLESLDRETVVFEGSAREAAGYFPKNINVAAALSLAGLGPDKTRVRIIADPHVTTNSHEIEAIGQAGRVLTRTVNVPSAFNPKTSYLAALSGIATLQGIVNPVKVGT
ncbi:MAG: aspartate dehydrogenase [bacterium]